MTTITVTYGADDAYLFAQAHLAPDAWRAIHDALDTIRRHKKHDILTLRECLDDVHNVLLEASAKLGDENQC